MTPAVDRPRLRLASLALLVSLAGCRLVAGYDPAGGNNDAALDTWPLDAGSDGWRLDTARVDFPTLDHSGDALQPCSGSYSWGSSASEPTGEHLFVVTNELAACTFRFIVEGAGGGHSNGVGRGGHGGSNTFRFVPGQTGVLVMSVGGGGSGSSVFKDGASGGGASSVVFDPDLVTNRSDAFTLAIAGGGGGAGGDGAADEGEDGCDGNGDGAGASCPGVPGAPGTGAGVCSTWGDGCSKGCPATGYCQGGRGGAGSTSIAGGVDGGFGKGGGRGGDGSYGAGGGGGFGGGAASRYNGPGGGGAGEVFTVQLPAVLVNETAQGSSLGSGGRGGEQGSQTGEDGRIQLSISP